MDTKEKLLAELSARQGLFLSGQELAASLGVTRAAVWKAISALRAEGYSISAAPNRGYALSGEMDVLTAEAVRRLVPELPVTVEYVPSAPSTNGLLRDRALAGEREGLVLIAAEQTAGRGRYGRTFYSPNGTGLYMSVLLRPRFSKELAPMMTAMAAVAAAVACETVSGEKIAVKWVNDLLCRSKKVCGILTEASLSLETDCVDWVILGLGINVSAPAGGFPADLAPIAGALYEGEAPAGTRARLAAELLRELWTLYEGFSPADFLPEYRERQVVIGRTVEVLRPSAPPRRALALDIDDRCRLVVRFEDGEKAALNGGEVRIIMEG